MAMSGSLIVAAVPTLLLILIGVLALGLSAIIACMEDPGEPYEPHGKPREGGHMKRFVFCASGCQPDPRGRGARP